MAKGQSALEYMMTYGWAILIIVIVAVILYSMGIFNPRASVTAGSSGFSPFAASAAVCDGSGLTVAFTVGGIPDGATSAKITGASYSSGSGISSATGTDSSLGTTPITVTSGSSFNVTFPGTCLSGVAFSASGVVNYSVATSAGTATFTATGTIAGTGS
ncbi:MAG: hypothetical protein M1580_01640 [Candidatus Parvarchaeota archaeon]|nr:hypothetical protein [Candidatus Parvarchaeota archaeon]